MKQIKVFTTSSENNIAPQVNDWLKENKDKKINNIQFTLTRSDYRTTRGVMIIFEKGGEK